MAYFYTDFYHLPRKVLAHLWAALQLGGRNRIQSKDSRTLFDIDRFISHFQFRTQPTAARNSEKEGGGQVSGVQGGCVAA